MEANDDLSVLRTEPFAKAVADLEGLMTQSGRTFLIGAGCSSCAGLPLTAELTEKTLNSDKINKETKTLLDAIRKQFDGSSDANIEDFLSELIDLIAIAQRRNERGASNAQIELGGKSYTAKQLQLSAEQIKRTIAIVIDQEVSVARHRSFIKAVHRPVRPGKSDSNQPVDYLVLNYDTLIEDALALEKISFSDGLGGGATAWWDMQTFRQSGLSARVLKLHGSINWCELSDDPLPRRISGKLTSPEISDRRVVIWPASTKYQEAQRDPYVQLTNLAREILRPIRGAQTVLTICGYRFRDSHINLEVDRALKESEGRLTVVVFTSDDGPEGQLKSWHEDQILRDQVRIYSKKGFFHGSDQYVSENELPWWKFENMTRLLGGER